MLSGARDTCPQSVAGTLVVGCIGAQGLYQADHHSASDPYCRVRIRDASVYERFGTRKHHVLRSSSLRSRVIHNRNNPRWREAFGIDMVCPALPYSYQLQVTIKDKSRRKRSRTLGNVFVDASEVVNRRVASRRFRFVDGPGSIAISLHWCPLGDHGCISQAARAAGAHGLSGRTSIGDCGEGCHSVLSNAMRIHTQSLAEDIEMAKRAELYGSVSNFGSYRYNRSNYNTGYDYSYQGFRCAVGDSVRVVYPGDHKRYGARIIAMRGRRKITVKWHYDRSIANVRSSNVFKYGSSCYGSQAYRGYSSYNSRYSKWGSYSTSQGRLWTNAYSKIQRLQMTMADSATRLCGPTAAAAIRRATRGIHGYVPRWQSGYSMNYANRVLMELNNVDYAIGQYSTGLEQKFALGQFLPNTESGIPNQCLGYFGFSGSRSRYAPTSTSAAYGYPRGYHSYDYYGRGASNYRYDYFRDTSYTRRPRSQYRSFYSRSWAKRQPLFSTSTYNGTSYVQQTSSYTKKAVDRPTVVDAGYTKKSSTDKTDGIQKFAGQAFPL